MANLLLLVGTALMAVSVIMAIIAVLQTQAPRGAAGIFVLGALVLGAGVWIDPAAMTPQNALNVWRQFFAGEFRVNPGPVIIEPNASAPAQ